MTCNGCRADVEKKIGALEPVENVIVSLAGEKATIASMDELAIEKITEALGEKYAVSEYSEPSQQNIFKNQVKTDQKSKWQQLAPLYIIFIFITGASILLHLDDGNTSNMMLDFMGLFYVVFSFFKILDLKGFPSSFAMYDPLAARFSIYGKVYPFIELGLGLMFLMRLELTIALIATLIILGITTIGVTKSLLNKKQIDCACLGTALKLPMTQATFIENTIMIIMAIMMLVQ